MHITLNVARSQIKRQAHSSSNLVLSVRESILLAFHPGIIQAFTSKDKFELYIENTC